MNFEKFSSPQNNEKKSTTDGEQLYFFDEHGEPEIDIQLSASEERALNELINGADNYKEISYEDIDANASEIIPEILKQFNKFDVKYSNITQTPDHNFNNSKMTNAMLANGCAKEYGHMGFYGKVFANEETKESFWEIWRIGNNGSDIFIQGKDGAHAYEQDLNPIMSSRELAEYKLHQLD